MTAAKKPNKRAKGNGSVYRVPADEDLPLVGWRAQLPQPPGPDGARRTIVRQRKTESEARAVLDALLAGEPLPANLGELRVRLAEVWAEGALWAAVECGAIRDERAAWIAPGDNPYQ